MDRYKCQFCKLRAVHLLRAAAIGRETMEIPACGFHEKKADEYAKRTGRTITNREMLFDGRLER